MSWLKNLKIGIKLTLGFAVLVTLMGVLDYSGYNGNRNVNEEAHVALHRRLPITNLILSAARAGQHGKGFAVVAEEVHNLAVRSSETARETADLIEGSVQKAENGVGIAQRTAEALSEIVTGITKTTDLVAEIAAAANEQSQGIGQINQGLSQIESVTQ